MSAASGLLAMGRRRHESIMDSTVRIRRKGERAFDEATGKYTNAWTTIYEGPARVRFREADPVERDSSGQRLAEQSPTVALPIAGHPDITVGSSGAVRVDDIGEVIKNPDDVEVVGTDFRIAGVHSQTHSTARRFPVEVNSHA